MLVWFSLYRLTHLSVKIMLFTHIHCLWSGVSKYFAVAEFRQQIGPQKHEVNVNSVFYTVNASPLDSFRIKLPCTPVNTPRI